MKIVGEKLEDWALKEPDIAVKDKFGRSAFNRFYYATFLATRAMLGALDKKWLEPSHGEIPNLLEGKVKKSATQVLKSSLKNSLITHKEHSALLSGLNHATSDLANLMREAYDIRRIADYEPEMKIKQNQKVISLHTCKLTTACTWPDRANRYCSIIQKVWKETGLA